MANFIYPTREQWEVLQVLGLDNPGGITVIIHPDVAARADAEGLDLGAPKDTYDSGGEPDVWLDVVDSTEHYLYGLAQEAGED